MIGDLNNREFLLVELPQVTDELRRIADGGDGGPSEPSAIADVPSADAAVAALDLVRPVEQALGADTREGATPRRRRSGPPQAYADADLDGEEAEPFLPDDPVLSLVQSSLDEYFEEVEDGAVEILGDGSALLSSHDEELARPNGRSLFGQFQLTDPRWVASAVSWGLRFFTDKHPFDKNPAPPVALHPQARLVMVGDWGSGIPRAQAVAELMRHHVEEALGDGLRVHVIHLGDVYYSGLPREYRKRFLPYWPVRDDETDHVASWCLNANHDMYSGGYGYFDHLLADERFARHHRSSWFTLENDDWCIVGLDTAWDETGLRDPRTVHGLVDPQARRIGELARRDDRALVLLSHHPLFSAFKATGPVLRDKLRPVLGAGRVKAWFWGHEHRAVAYAPHGGVDFGRCLGHGGVPVWPGGAPDANGPPVVWWEKGVVDGLVEDWASFGFAVADLDGPSMHVRYVGEDGAVAFEEEIRA